MRSLLLACCLVVGFAGFAVEPTVIRAIIQVESNGRDNAIGDHGRAYGPLQIHAVVVKDVNRIYGTSYKHHDMFVREIAIEVCNKYLDFYGSQKRLGRPATTEDLVRIWNGGPDGWRQKATEKYWLKVRKYL